MIGPLIIESARQRRDPALRLAMSRKLSRRNYSAFSFDYSLYREILLIDCIKVSAIKSMMRIAEIARVLEAQRGNNVMFVIKI